MKEVIRMKKFKVFFDIVKEEQWINEQLQQGYCLKNISCFGMYTFEKVTDDFVMRLDYQDYLSKEKYEEYKSIYQDFGWIHVKGSRYGSVQYWQKVADSQTDIFSDRQSYSDYYKRLMNYSFSLCLTFLVLCFFFYRDTGIYLTEGLWQMKGSLFWKAFLFETPFALLRLLPLIFAVICGLSFLKAYRHYSILKDK